MPRVLPSKNHRTINPRCRWTQAGAPQTPPVPPTPASALDPRGPLYQPSVLAFDPNHEHKVVQREQVANPVPLGLFAFGEESGGRPGSGLGI